MPAGSAAAGWPATTWSWPPPRTLSALAWFLLCAGQEELAEPIHQAHEEAVLGVSVEFTCAVGTESPTDYDVVINTDRIAPHQFAELLANATSL